MNKSRGFAQILIAIAVLVFVSVGAYYVVNQNKVSTHTPGPCEAPGCGVPQNNQTQETANWKTYTNAEYGFEFKYPPAWNLKDNSLSFSTKNGYIATFGVEGIALVTKDFTIDEMRKEYDRANTGNSHAPKASEVLKDIFIGNEAGLEWAVIACEQRNSCYARYEFNSNSTWRKGFKFYFVVPNLKSSDVDSSYNPRPLFSEDIIMVRKVLSTLEFTKSTAIYDETANWKTYTNSKYGFEFKYPAEYKIIGNEMSILVTSTGALTVLANGQSEGFDVYRVRSDDIAWFSTQSMALDLKSFTEKSWQINKSDSNPYISKEVGSIVETKVAGRKAYQFSLSGSFTSENGGGFVLKQKHIFIFTEDLKGNKFVLWMPAGNQTNDKILATFEFTN